MTTRPLPQRFYDRFWSLTTPEPNTGCLLWTGTVTHGGYGRYGILGATEAAHRLAWEFVNGPVPDGLWVLHHCDNPACVYADEDPAKSHLFLGTALDNVHDMIAKGRANWVGVSGNRNGSRTRPDRRPRGGDNGRAKLSVEQVRVIRARCAAEGKVYAALAREYGVTPANIRAIAIGRLWRHVA